jgi:transcriptional regulator with XRE-family HTH domain
MMDKENVALLFAENLTRYRKKKGLSQYDLAELTGISRTMISHYEREGIIPPADKLQSITTVLEIPVCKLFERNTHTLNSGIDLSGIDPRSVKKFRDILSLPVDDRNDIYRILNKMLRKNQLERQSSAI